MWHPLAKRRQETQQRQAATITCISDEGGKFASLSFAPLFSSPVLVLVPRLPLLCCCCTLYGCLVLLLKLCRLDALVAERIYREQPPPPLLLPARWYLVGYRTSTGSQATSAAVQQDLLVFCAAITYQVYVDMNRAFSPAQLAGGCLRWA